MAWANAGRFRNVNPALRITPGVVQIFRGRLDIPFFRTEWIADALGYVLQVQRDSELEYEIDGALEINVTEAIERPVTYPLDWGVIDTTTVSFIPVPIVLGHLQSRLLLVADMPLECTIWVITDRLFSDINDRLTRLTTLVEQLSNNQGSNGGGTGGPHLYP